MAVDKLNDFFLNANRGKRVPFVCEGESLTQQQWKDIVNVNNIVKSMTQNAFNKSWFDTLGQQVMSDASKFADVSSVPDLQTAYNMMEQAKSSFVNTIPSTIRAKFNNDPVAFYKFVADPKNTNAVRNMLSDYANYVAPNVEQVQDGNNQVVVDAVDSNAAKQNKA